MKAKSLLSIIAISLILILIDNASILYPVKKAFSFVFNPLEIGFNRASRKVGTEISTLGEIGTLRDKNRELEYNIALITAENTLLKKLRDENQILKDQLGSKDKFKKVTLADTIGFSTVGSVKYLMLDRGSEDGIKKDQLVILRDILIGKIVGVTPKSANVMLITDPDFKVPSITSQKSKGLLIGQYQQEMKLTKVLPEEKLASGDMVLSSGESGFPQGLVLGKVESTQKNDKDIFQEGVVKPLLNLEKLEVVFVME